MEVECKIFSDKNIIDIIVPLRLSKNYNHVDRLCFLNELKMKNCNLTIVNDGSDDNYSSKIDNFCMENFINYIKINSQHKIFSASRARNIGSMFSLCKYILFKDFDVFIDKNFMNNLFFEIQISDIDHRNNEFFAFPILFLTKYGSDLLKDVDINNKLQYAISAFLQNDNAKLENYGPGFGALFLVNRYHYLSIGGMDEQYTGWGCEDLDLFYRLILESNFIEKPSNITVFDKLYQINERRTYIGFRAYLYALSEYFSRKGMYGIHFYHKKTHAEDTWYSSPLARYNEKRLEHRISNKINSNPLPALEYGKTLLIDKHIYSLNRDIMPFYGIVDIHNVDYFDATDIISYIQNNHIDRVVFVGPYGSEKKKNLFYKIRDNNINFAVIERGALPDSIYIDDTGFCSESKRYESTNWDIEYNEDYISIAKKYIKDYFVSSNSLEEQNEKIGSTELVKKLGFPPDKKVLFVPLQTEYDVTMKFFCKSIGGFQGFISVLRKLAYRLPADWVMVVKNHPLTDKKINIPNAIMSDDNIDDLLSISSIVLLINSGVGILSMLHLKPVLYMGETFYAHDDINRKVSSIEDILYYMENTFCINEIKIYKFIYYLISNFHCFGTSETKKVQVSNNSFISRTINLNLNKVIVPWSNDKFYKYHSKSINSSSIIFSKFNFSDKDIYTKNNIEHYTKKEYSDKNYKTYSEKQKKRFRQASTKNKNFIYNLLMPKHERKWKLINKLKNNPYAFCADSKYTIVRMARILFKNKS